ncbi:MAG: hypothetical protein AAB508_05205 [Patescibacteria group bacterium]
MYVATNKLSIIVIPTVLVAIVAVVLFSMIQPLAKPALQAISEAIESIQVAHAAVPAQTQTDVSKKPIGSGQAVVSKGPSTTWTSIHFVGNPPKYKCNILGVFVVLGKRFDLSKYLDEECTAKNVGDALREYIENIKKSLKLIKNPNAQIMKEALEGLEAFEKLLIERGLLPPAP